MMKHYAKYTFKKWWPVLLVISALFITVLSYAGLVIPTSYTPEISSEGSATVFYTLGIVSVVIGLPATVALPIFVHSYRTRRRSVDTYYQSSIDSRKIRKAHMLIALAFLAIGFTAGFLMGFLVYSLRYLGTPLTEMVGRYNRTYQSERYNLNFIGFLLIYLIILIVLVGQFFLNCFLASLGNYVLDQIFLMIFGNAFLYLCIMAPYLYFLSITHFSVNTNTMYGLLYGLGSTGPLSFLYAVTIPVVCGFGVSMATLIHSSIATLISFAAYILALIGLLKMKDPSGEYANNRKPIHPFVRFIPHLAALCIGFIIALDGIAGRATTGSGIGGSIFLVLPFFLHILFCLVYFMLLALWRHSFKFSKADWISFACVCGATLFFTIVNCAVYW